MPCHSHSLRRWNERRSGWTNSRDVKRESFRDKYHGSGYVFIAGSLSHRVLKIGTGDAGSVRDGEARLEWPPSKPQRGAGFQPNGGEITDARHRPFLRPICRESAGAVAIRVALFKRECKENLDCLIESFTFHTVSWLS